MESRKDISAMLLHHKDQKDTPFATTSCATQASTATSADEASQDSVSHHPDLNVAEAALTVGLDRLNICEESVMAERMFPSLDIVFQRAAKEYELVSNFIPISPFLRVVLGM